MRGYLCKFEISERNDLLQMLNSADSRNPPVRVAALVSCSENIRRNSLLLIDGSKFITVIRVTVYVVIPTCVYVYVYILLRIFISIYIRMCACSKCVCL